jgi:uncharacterized surface protein with fasciclin (FAS1) repeats
MSDHQFKNCALALGLSLALAACGSETEIAAGPDDRSDDPLSEVISDNASLAMAMSGFELTGLIGVLEGDADYSVFAPTDAAFQELGAETSTLLEEEAHRAILAAILREHMVPGALTPDEIRDAVDSNGGEVYMTSFGAGTLVFSIVGEDLVVTNETGQQARLGDDAVIANNGVVIPIDSVLVDPAALPAPADSTEGG